MSKKTILEKKTLNEIMMCMGAFQEEQFIFHRKNDSFKQTIEEILNVNLRVMAILVMKSMHQKDKKEWFDHNFPNICIALEKHFLSAMEDTNDEEEKSCVVH